MPKLFLITLLTVASAVAQQGGGQPAPSKAPPSRAKVLKRAELDALLATPGQVLLLDVRRPDEVISIGGFPAYLSIQAADLEKYLGFIPKDRTIVTISNHAARAGRAADLLESKGFKVAGAGVEDYEAEGGHVLKIVPPKPAADNKK